MLQKPAQLEESRRSELHKTQQMIKLCRKTEIKKKSAGARTRANAQIHSQNILGFRRGFRVLGF